MPSFPSELPRPLQSGYGLQHVSPFIRTEMQSGRARQRRTFTNVPSSVSVTWFFTSTGECALFEGWFRDAGGAGDGANWFTMRLQTPIADAEFNCRFAGMYQGPTLSAYDKWQVTATLEIRERPIIAEDWAIIMPGYILMADILDYAINREWPSA